MKTIHHKRFCIFGDVHGCASEFESLIKKVRKQFKNIPLYGTGDLIDRGPDSKEVLDLCIKYKIKNVLGNHDDALNKFLNGDLGAFSMHIYPGMGGKATYKSYMDNELYMPLLYKEAIPNSHQDYLQNLPLVRIINTSKEKYIITHAGISNNSIQFTDLNIISKEYSIKKNSNKLIQLFCEENKEDIIWNHKNNNMSLCFGRKQILGHYPQEEVKVTDTYIIIDTGSGKHGKLSAIILPDYIIIN